MKVKLVLQIVDKNAALWLELRTWSKVSLWYNSEEELESWIWTIEKLEDIKKDILVEFAKFWRELSETEYLDVYIEEADDEIEEDNDFEDRDY